MAYLLATIGTKVQWYVVDLRNIAGRGSRAGIAGLQKGEFDLVDILDLEVVPGFGDKNTAKKVAMAIGLTTWRYVKMDGPKQVFTEL